MSSTPKRFLVGLFAALILAAPAAVIRAGQESVDVKKVDLEQFEALRHERDVVVLDVRTPEEFERGHVPGARRINWRDRDFNEQVTNLDKSKKYVVYCQAGIRSANAAKRMGELGFAQLFEFSGGWRVYGDSGKPIATGAAPHGAAAAGNALGDMTPTIHPATETKWVDGPASLPKGAKVALLEGDPAKDGPFTFRVKLPDGYRIPPHTHPKVERITVISGTFNLGMGKTADDTKMHKMPAGSYGYWPAGMIHYASATGETVLQLHGVGPWTIEYVNPADDPRKANGN